jgi:hypothetical protein
VPPPIYPGDSRRAQPRAQYQRTGGGKHIMCGGNAVNQIQHGKPCAGGISAHIRLIAAIAVLIDKRNSSSSNPVVSVESRMLKIMSQTTFIRTCNS